MFKVAYSYCHHPDDRADLAQEIATQLWRAFPGYDASRASFSTWMYRIALNVAISQLRSNRHRQQRPAGQDHPPPGTAALLLDEVFLGLQRPTCRTGAASRPGTVR